MTDISQNVGIKNLLMLLEETFEGPGGNIYLDKGGGLYNRWTDKLRNENGRATW